MKPGTHLIVMLIAAAVVLLAGCRGDSSGGTWSDRALKPSQYTSAVNQNPDIILRTDRKSYAAGTTSAQLIIENRSADRGLTYGVDYQIEVLKNGTWYQVPFRDDVQFILIAAIHDPGKTYRTELSFSDDLLKFPLIRGKYRIVKEINDGTENGIYATEFQII